MPTPKKPAQKPRKVNKGPASRSLLGRIKPKNRFGIRPFDQRALRAHFNEYNSDAILPNTEIGKAIRKLLRVRNDDKVEVSSAVYSTTLGGMTYLVFEVNSNSREGLIYFSLPKDHKSGLFNIIRKEYP
ncbi:MAG: hypothetical protein COT15_03075 [Candidatus Diapherotrites archaeon CG08_land_8_20_14_0_20_34_12]|nr:MAG: hypothetical protein COT15_03075 [Candidatus Diapherotrites archaeon CG08_land_8_20_14_0_20_34_12]